MPPKQSAKEKKLQKKKEKKAKKEAEEAPETNGDETPEMGKGCFEFPNGAMYDGEWKIVNAQKARHGRGVFVNSGEVYRGEWQNNLIHGQGQYEFANGSIYKGELADNMFDGVGTYRWANGSSYSGQWYRNRMHGLGTYTTVDGNRYHGTYDTDKFLNEEGHWIPPEELDNWNFTVKSSRQVDPDVVRTFRGRCLCGGVRIHVTTPIVKSYYCHCNICRKYSGGPYTLYMSVNQAQVKFTGMKGFKTYTSSEGCIRYRCKHCGSPLATHLPAKQQYRVPLARFVWHGNQIDRIVDPKYHEYYGDRCVDMIDNLTKYRVTYENGDTMGNQETVTDKKRGGKAKSADRKRNSDNMRGSCLCGLVTISTTGQPLGSGGGHYCHCRVCQSYSGAPCISYGTFSDAVVNFSGSDNLRSYEAVPGAMRYRCRNCATLCRVHLASSRKSLIPLSLLTNQLPHPMYHQYYSVRLIDIEDCTTKFQLGKGTKVMVASMPREQPRDSEAATSAR